MTRPFNGPFTLREGTSRYDGVPLWRELMSAGLGRAARSGSPTRRDAGRPAGRDRRAEHRPGQGLDAAAADLGRADRRGEHRRSPARRGRAASVGALARERRRASRRRDVRPRARRPRHRLPLVERDAGVARPAARRAAAPADDRRGLRRRRPPRLRRRRGVVHALPAHLVAGGAGLAAGGGDPPDHRDPGRGARTHRPRRPAAGSPPPTSSSSTRSGWRSVGAARSDDRVTGTPRFRSSAVGVRATIVNGAVVVDDGEPTGATPGQVVRPR